MDNTNITRDRLFEAIISPEHIILHIYGAHPRKIFREDIFLYTSVMSLLHQGQDEKVLELLDVSSRVAEDSHLSVREGRVYYQEIRLHQVLERKLMRLLEQESPDLARYVRFVERCMSNPSNESKKDLYAFLEHEGLPILSEGRFLAYKYVSEDYKDTWTGNYDNRVGKSYRIDRSEVDPNRQNPCSCGFHVGSYEYALAGVGDSGHLMFVAVAPEDVVSVPLDSGCQKCRTCAYEVIGEDTTCVRVNQHVVYDDHFEVDDNDDLERQIVDSLIEHYRVIDHVIDVNELMQVSKLTRERDWFYDVLDELGYDLDEQDIIT
jgi:hypothetical protein